MLLNMNNFFRRPSSLLALLWLLSAGCGGDKGATTPTPVDEADAVASVDGQASGGETSQSQDTAESAEDVTAELVPDGTTGPEPDAGPVEPLTYPHAEEGASMVIPAEAAFVAPELDGGLAWSSPFWVGGESIR